MEGVSFFEKKMKILAEISILDPVLKTILDLRGTVEYT
jgi:hypothetical protein